MDTSKIVKATRITPDLYSVSFPGTVDVPSRVDSGVTMAHLQELAKQGYRVEIDQSAHRGPAEPAHYVIALRGPLAPGTVITDGAAGGPTELA